MSGLLNDLDDINQSSCLSTSMAARQSTTSSTKKKSKGGKPTKRKSSTGSAKSIEQEQSPTIESVVMNSPEPQQPPVSKARTSNTPDLLQFSFLQGTYVDDLC